MQIIILEQGSHPSDIQTAKETITQDFNSYIEEARKGFVDQEDRKITLLEDVRTNDSSHFFQYFVKYSHGHTKTINQYIMCVDTTLDFTEPSIKEQKQSQERGVFIPQSLLDYSIPRKLKTILSYANEDKKLDSLSEDELAVLNKAFDFITTVHFSSSIIDLFTRLEGRLEGLVVQQPQTQTDGTNSHAVSIAREGYKVTETFQEKVGKGRD